MSDAECTVVGDNGQESVIHTAISSRETRSRFDLNDQLLELVIGQSDARRVYEEPQKSQDHSTCTSNSLGTDETRANCKGARQCTEAQVTLNTSAVAPSYQ
jgi:hypothetical protein